MHAASARRGGRLRRLHARPESEGRAGIQITRFRALAPRPPGQCNLLVYTIGYTPARKRSNAPTQSRGINAAIPQSSDFGQLQRSQERPSGRNRSTPEASVQADDRAMAACAAVFDKRLHWPEGRTEFRGPGREGVTIPG